jgi:hypothetical protein
MPRLFFILLFASIGGTFILHYLKNFLLKEKIKFYFDWDGILERLCIAYIILETPQFWLLIPLIILVKLLMRIYLLKSIAGLTQTSEPGIASQKVLYKAELAFDTFASPAFAILVGVIFR